MGLIRKLLGGLGSSPAIENGVRGTAQVVSCSGYHGRAVWQSCSLQLVVQAEGVSPTAMEIQALVHRDRWPTPGMTLPVTIDPANPQNARIEWDEVQSAKERARLTAEALAATMRGEGDGAEQDRVTRLERLAKLRESGALSDAEFEAEKKKVLES